MKKETAKAKIKNIWIEQDKPKPVFPEAMIFYNYLKKNHFELVSFKTRNEKDKYQIIKGFITEYSQKP